MVITLRDTHFKILQIDIPTSVTFHSISYKLRPSIISTEILLQKYLKFYEIKLAPQTTNSEFIETSSLLHEKSEEGLPYYIHHFVQMLSLSNRVFSKKEVEKIPLGMRNLIFYTIDEELYDKDNPLVILLLFLLLNQRKTLPLSFDFIDFMCKWYMKEVLQENELNKILNKLSILKLYLSPKHFPSKRIEDFKFEKGELKSKIERFQLDEKWKDSLEYGLRKPNKLALPFKSLEQFFGVQKVYKSIKQDFVEFIRSYLNTIFENHPTYDQVYLSAILLTGLAKFDNKQLFYCSELFQKFKDKMKWSDFYLYYIRSELSLAWFLSALDLRDQKNYDKAELFIKEALNIKEFKLALHFYAHLLERKLTEMKREESEKVVEDIRNLYKKLIEIDEGDYITWQSRAIFHRKIGEFEEAEIFFERAYNLDRSYIPILLSYAIFNRQMGNLFWNTDREKAEIYLDDALRIFEEGIKIVEITGFSERQFLNAYANFLLNLAWKKESIEEKFVLDVKADNVWQKLIEKSKIPRTINGYSDFLLKVGWRLEDRYPGGKYGNNLQIAEEYLRECIKVYEDPISQNILARLLYKYKQICFTDYQEKEILFQEAMDLLNKSATNPKISFLTKPMLHEASCYHEIGKLYMVWADVLEEEAMTKRNFFMKKAKENLKHAINIPENNFTYQHFCSVYQSLFILYTQYYIGSKNARKANEYAEKIVEFAKNVGWSLKDFFADLLKMGDEFIEEQPKLALLYYKNAVEIEKRNFQILGRLGKSYSNLADIEEFEENISKAIDYYYEAAKVQNTMDGYQKFRDLIQVDIKEKIGYLHGDLWSKCLEYMKFCSKNIFEKTRDVYWIYWNDHINYSIDLIELGRWLSYENINNAIDLFKTAEKVLNPWIEVFQDTRLLEEDLKDNYEQILHFKEISQMWIEKLEPIKSKGNRERLMAIDVIFNLDIETSEKLGDIKRKLEISREYMNVLFPLKIINNKELEEMGNFFMKNNEYKYAYDCFKDLRCREYNLIENTINLATVKMKQGRFEEAIKNFQDILKFEKNKIFKSENKINLLIYRCKNAIRSKNQLSKGLRLLLKIAEFDPKIAQDKLAAYIYKNGKRLLKIRNQFNLTEIMLIISEKETDISNIDSLNTIPIPFTIIRSCFWKAKDLGFKLPSQVEQILVNFESQLSKVYLYTAIGLKEKAKKARNMKQHLNFIRATFFYLFFLAITIKELLHDKRGLSERWGKTGGSLVDINKNSLIKISPLILIKCFIHSINNNNMNYISWSQLGRLYFQIGKFNDSLNLLDEAEDEFNIRKKKNRFSTTGLRELAELRGQRNKALRYYMEAIEIIKLSSENEIEKVKSYKSLANKLIKLGFIEEAIEVIELMKELLVPRQKMLMNARIQLLKNQIVLSATPSF